MCFLVLSGDDELSLRFIVLLLCDILVFTVMSKPVMGGVNLDEPGFTAPAGSAPPSSDSSADPPPESRSKCVSCPRRMSAKTADLHTICVACRGFDCFIDTRCEECIDWPEEDVRVYAKMRKSLKSKRRDKSAASPPPPPAESVPSSQPDAIVIMQTRVASLNALVNSLSESFFARMDALQVSLVSSLPQSSSRPSHRPDASTPQPGVTTDESRMFQAMGESCRKTGESHSLGQDTRPPRTEFTYPAAASQPREAPSSDPQPSAFVPPPPPLAEVPPQPSTSRWVPSGPPPPRSRGSRSSSETEASDSESVSVTSDSAFARLAELIYDVCPNSRPLLDDSRPPQCELEGWFGQPEASPARPHFRLYLRVAEVESEVTAKAGSLASRSKPLSSILTTCFHRHAVADMPHFASSLAVNPSFSQLAGAKAVGSKRWGSISFSEMEKLERVFRSQLEMTSKSLWLLSGILAMLKRDGFQPADPTLFNAALALASATLSQQARSSASGSTFLHAKCRVSLLAHTAIPVPETQRRSLTVSPGSETLLFDEEMLGVVVSLVQQSSLISSNLAMSRSLARGRGCSSSSPVVDPSPASTSRSGRPHYKRSSSASRSGGRKRFRGGKRSAPSSGPLGFRK